MNVLPFKSNADTFGATKEAINNYLNPSNGGILWSVLKADAPTRITSALLAELTAVQMDILQGFSSQRQADSIRYHVLTSDIEGIFSLGGDLAYFCQCAKSGNRRALTHYARDSIEFVYQAATNYHLPITTISLVKGAALGGGFEAALAANYLIAEEQATFAFPETRFGLFPGMGAYTFLRQRVPGHLAEEIIYSGKLYTARELYDMKVIDQLCATGQGDKTTLQFIARRSQQHQGIHAMRHMVQQFSPINKQELYSIVDYWVESVFKLDSKQLRLIEALAQTHYRPPGKARTVDGVY